MPTGDFGCGLEVSLYLIASKWKPLVLFHLEGQPRRYGDLRRAIGGVSDKVLIQSLKEMSADGLIDRIDFGEIPPRVEYRLTDFGRSLGGALKPLCAWGDQHKDTVQRLAREDA